ncbi:MAG: HEAT repeat domain-containing protein, partial [Deltaproteobacteria bacterium]|nr:HEAT repeat domain-containing protein [Deltaproteobacteria bacterium]
AIDVLGKIALRWEPFADTQDAKREAIKALGIIGDPRAVPYLTSVLFKKAWIGKRTNEEVRSLAAYSLGMIGGAGAFDAIEQVEKSSRGELYITCKRILEGREKTT